MSIVIRAAAAYLVLVAVAIPVHYFITPFYHSGDDPHFAAWAVMNWFMAPAVIAALVVGYVGKRRIDGDAAVDMKRYLEANSLFYVAVAVFIIYFWNWFNALSPINSPDRQFWTVLGAAMPIVLGVAGCRLWRMPAGSNVKEERLLP